VLGYYVVGVAWSAASGPLITAVGNVAFPRVAAPGTSGERIRMLTQASRLGALTAASVALLLFVTTPAVIPLLFGREFTPAIPATLILVVAGVFGAVNNILEEAVRGLGHPKVVLSAETVGLATAAISLALLLPRLGIVGAALASLFSYALTMVVLVRQVTKITGCTSTAVVWPRREDLRLIRDRLQLVYRGS
jgi:O-antigen/teichoic acid export membrane protein